MKTLFVDDFPVFFNREEFAVEAMIQGRRVAGLACYHTVLSNGVETQKTSFIYPSRYLLHMAQGEHIQMEEQTYTVVGIQADGTGLTTLRLELICTSP